ncbi:MAG: MBL fold metallo-hydrolase [Bacteroidia bacterium]|jgi:L-ascorbate metabolism protein UlaG (beta-lactamase superfamily)
MQIHSKHITTSLHDSLNQPEQGLSFYWLGQAGFAFKINETCLLIDPYLSDSLAEKYKGTTFPHKRMIEIPVQPENLTQMDWVFCTHRHTDHMDPETLKQIHQASPKCRFLIPKVWVQRVIGYAIPKELIRPINAGESLKIGETITVQAIPAAHEQIEMDSENNHLYLGYILKTNFAAIYHSGDCVPYLGLVEKLKYAQIDLAFLPVSGRDYYRKQRGVPGNFTIDEAIDICLEAGIPNLVCHHFGMFDFNTIDEDMLYKKKQNKDKILNIIIPEMMNQYQIIRIKNPANHEA